MNIENQIKAVIESVYKIKNIVFHEGEKRFSVYLLEPCSMSKTEQVNKLLKANFGANINAVAGTDRAEDKNAVYSVAFLDITF